MELLRAVDPDELAALQSGWGLFPVESATLSVSPPFLTGKDQFLTNRGRRAEVCYVMHRGDPADGVLLHIKTFYPPGAFRLPTGGIQQGERVDTTLAREIDEETGLAVGVGAECVRVERCLGVLAYALDHATLGAVEFATWHFLVQMPAGAQLQPRDASERIGGWLWRPAAALWDVAARLEREESADWRDWGRFRALSHRFVARVLDTTGDSRRSTE
jgi:8-oxo-dGTP pyrophosphatase MutT (NUDIX family)